MKFALIIQGTSGSGKSTVARTIARSREVILLEHDTFLFGTQLHKPEVEQHFTIGNAMIWECFKVALESQQPIIIEGVLASLDKKINEFDIQQYLDKLNEFDYKIIRVVLKTDYETAKARMSNRLDKDGCDTAVPKDLFDKTTLALEDIIPADVLKIDTSHMSTKDVVETIEKLLPVFNE